MFQNIPISRLLTYIMLVGMVPICMVLVHFQNNQKQVNELEEALSVLQQSALLREKRQSLNMAVRNHFRDTDHFYLDKHIETLSFLETEIESLQKILSQSHFAEDENVKKRLEYLSQGNNLQFSEGVVQSHPLFQEVVESQVHPVEVNTTDLQKLLAKVEGIEIANYGPGPNRPQLLIIDFRLDKKKITDKNEVFMLNMKLLKREFL